MDIHEINDSVKQIYAKNNLTFLVLGDTLIDKSLLLEKTEPFLIRSTDAEVFKLKNESVCFGGASFVASELATIGAKVVLADVKPDVYSDNSLLDELYHGLSKRKNLTRIPFYNTNYQVDIVTRLYYHDYQNRINLKLKYSQYENTKIQRSTFRSTFDKINEHIGESILNGLILVDLGRGSLSEEIIEMALGLCSEDTKIFLCPYRSLKKYIKLNCEVLITRPPELKYALNEFKNELKFLSHLNETDQFLSIMQNVKILAVIEHKGISLSAVVREQELSNYEVCYLSNPLRNGILIGTRLMFLTYFAAALIAKINVIDSLSFGFYNIDKYDVFTENRDLRKNTQVLKNEQLSPKITKCKLSLPDLVMADIALSNFKININNAKTKVPNIYTYHSVLKQEINKTFDLINSIKSENNLVCLILYGDSGSGKSYIADQLINFSVNELSKVERLTFICSEYGIDTTARNTKEILKSIYNKKRCVVFLDEIDKFQGKTRNSQSLFLDLLNSGRINDVKITGVVIGATSLKSIDERLPETQLKDIYTRFPIKIRVPSIKERMKDLLIFLVLSLKEDKIHGISEKALREVLDDNYANLRDFKIKIEQIKANIQNERIIRLSTLKPDSDIDDRSEVIKFQFPY